MILIQYQNFSQEKPNIYQPNQPGALTINKYGEPFLSNLNLYHNVNDLEVITRPW